MKYRSFQFKSRRKLRQQNGDEASWPMEENREFD